MAPRPAAEALAVPTNTATNSSQVSDSDRLGFTVVMILALHALIIFGLSFETLKPDASAKLLEVTLTQFKNDDEPDKADFAAQHNQSGSGSLEDAAQIKTDNKSVYQDNIVKHIQLNKPTVVKPEPLKQKKIIVSQFGESKIYANKNKEVVELENLERAEKNQRLQQQMEIASLQAKLSQQKQLFAKGPKVRQITSVSARASEDAAYINSFREKIEYIGNKYYPEEAKRKGYEGDVQLIVSLKADGNIESVQLIKSSNNPVLDKAAIDSVRLAAPFQPFPTNMRKNTDILEIIRTWQFRRELMSTRS